MTLNLEPFLDGNLRFFTFVWNIVCGVLEIVVPIYCPVEVVVDRLWIDNLKG